uniref:Endonuclease/exonuclease/phosphatase domain-containing protein n=1 Tax=Gouania willdenowi TaxID=441366 RepID=A0A8C5E3K7_GOUWI
DFYDYFIHLNFLFNCIFSVLISPIKRSATLSSLRSQKIQIALLQETHLVKRDRNRFANKFFKAFSSAPNKSNGVAILVRHNLQFKQLDSWSDDKGRIVVFKLNIERTNLALISLYAPNILEKEFYDQITETILELSSFKLIVAVFPLLLELSKYRRQWHSMS